MKTPDIIFEHHKYKRKNFILHFIILLLLLIIIAILQQENVVESKLSKKDYIARIFINDVITENFSRVEKIQELANNNNIKAVIMHVNSPGGTVYGSEQLFRSLRNLAQKKTLVAFINSIGASGGYWISTAADHIIAGNTSVVGSIGVVMESYDITGFLQKKLGIEPVTFKTSPLKAIPSPTEKLTPETKAAISNTMNDVFEIFKKSVQDRRGLSKKELEQVANGNIFIGKKALEYKLIDDIGDENTILKYLQDKKNISSKLKVRNHAIIEEDKLSNLFNMKSLLQMIHNFFIKFSNQISY